MQKIFKILFISILTSFSLGQLARIQLNEVLIFYIHDLFILAWISLAIFQIPQQLWQLIKKYFFHKLTYLLVGWVGIGLIANFISHGFSIIPYLYIARTATYLIFGLSLPIIKPFPVESIKRLWVGVGMTMALIGLGQYLWLPDTRFIKYLGWDDHYYRLISTLLDPNFTGIILVVTFLITQGLQIKRQWLKISLSVLLAGAILLTYSRASFLSFIIGCGLLIFMKSYKKSISLIILVSLFVFSIPFLPRPEGEGVKLERTASISARIESNQRSLLGLSKYEWLTGRGLFIYQQQTLASPQTPWPSTAHFPNNLIIFLLASTGVVGLRLSMLVLYQASSYLYRNDPYLFVALIAVLIHAQFNHTLFQPFVWLWLMGQFFITSEART